MNTFRVNNKRTSKSEKRTAVQSYQDSVDALKNIFNKLELIVNGIACIKISDPEVKRILVEQLDKDGNGEVNENESENVAIHASWFSGNQKIKTFREMKKFKGIYSTHNYVFKDSTIEVIEFSAGQSLAGGAFYDCLNLREIVLPPDMTNLNWLKNNPSLEHVEIPETVESISADIFSYSLLEKIIIPEKVSSIGGGAFRYCNKLKILIIKTNLITNFSGYFLSDCPNVEVFVLYAKVPPILGWGSFDRTNSAMKIYVPDDSVLAYQAANGWKNRANYIYPLSSYEEL